MAMLVLLSFEDDNMALTLVEDILNNPESRILTPAQENDVAGKVEALYKMPTMWCPSHSGLKKTEAGFTKGIKYGWWVCAHCGKPRKMAWDNMLKNETSLGYNILTRHFDLDPVDPEPETSESLEA